MINFFLGMAVTWGHIICGFAMLGIVFILSYIISGSYNRHIENRDNSELDRVREALRNK